MVLLFFVIVVGLNNNVLSEFVLGYVKMYYMSILFGLITITLINSFTRTKYFNMAFLLLIIVNMIVVLSFPETTDYNYQQKKTHSYG